MSDLITIDINTLGELNRKSTWNGLISFRYIKKEIEAFAKWSEVTAKKQFSLCRLQNASAINEIHSHQKSEPRGILCKKNLLHKGLLRKKQT